MAQKTKKQHYIPQFYLNSWGIPSTKQIHVFDKKLDTVRINNIEDVASERYFYDVNPNDVLSEKTISSLHKMGIEWNSKEKSQGIEHVFAEELETPFSQLLKEIIKKADKATPRHIRSCYFISAKEKGELSAYLSFQFIRTKHIRNGIQAVEDCLSQLIESEPLFSPMAFTGDSKDEARNIHAQMLLDVKTLSHVASRFTELTWVLGINRTDLHFYTTDNPIGTFGHIIHPYMSMNGIASKGVEVFYPITPNVILIMVDGSVHTRQTLSRRMRVDRS